jgi:hypothetical protein
MNTQSGEFSRTKGLYSMHRSLVGSMQAAVEMATWLIEHPVVSIFWQNRFGHPNTA